MNIAIIEQGFGKYLFEVPESIALKEGEKVKCDTKRGVTDGTVWADSITTDEPTAKLIGKLLGAKFPLKSVVGKTVTSVEMFEQPEQPKREPVKLYCVKDCKPGNYLTKGKVYEYVPGNRFPYDDGYSGCPEKDYATWASFNPALSASLVPLVSRPAKVGEWVYVLNCDKARRYSGGINVGDISKVVRLIANYGVYIKTSEKTPYGAFKDGAVTLIKNGADYLVLDGYTPEPKKAEPEYYSGKVVCVEATDREVTLGKVYTVEKGVFTWNSGAKSDTKATTIERFNNWFIAAKFIEFKGE